MPTINFPSGPSLNDTYNLGVRTWKWNGDAWALQPLTGGFTGSQGYTGSVGIGYTGSAGYTGSNIALLDATQTLTNKTLTTPDVNTSLKMVSSGQLQFRDNQSYISENGGILLFNGAAGRGVRMYSGGAERVAVSYEGDLKLKAGTDIIFEGSSDGIYIGGTAAANKLDDYEEGTHTPTVTPQTSGTLAFGTGSTVMSYIKIGNRVFVNGYLLFSTVSSAVGDYFNTTLPFAIKTGLSSDSEWGGGSLSFYDLSETTYYPKPFVFTAGNSHFTTYMNLATELAANDRIAFSFSYQSA